MCTLSWWCRIVQKLSEEQKDVVRALGFGYLLAFDCGRSNVFGRVVGIPDHGEHISILGDVPNKDFWESKFAITSCSIFLKDIEHSLEEMSTPDDEFKILIEDCFNQAAPSGGQNHTATHVATGHGNQEPGIGNDAHIQGITDVL
ncbi:hypothetical protein Ddye_015685 [Dipteronia dyeriana]|uniref:Uncharacterized protein n=1 Tax=Dipteronia dyeriana TaxID=168575 RepID=A0AAD9WYQ2_9ROSI|nr:hypothetical protein Ddye_015685 [Dipteronia dyeriana]